MNFSTAFRRIITVSSSSRSMNTLVFGSTMIFGLQQQQQQQEDHPEYNNNNNMKKIMMMNGGGRTTTTVMCESSRKNNNDHNNKPLSEVIIPKKADGSIDFHLLSSNVYWDQVGAAAGKQVQGVIDSGIPTQLSYGFISGYCSGLAFKKVGRIVAIVFGLGFMSLQTLSYYGYVNVDHNRIKQDVENVFDLNKDGKIDTDDATIAYNKTLQVLQFGMPSGGGFIAGFIGGIRSG